MFMKRKIKSAKGFTLAELLIVVAIIAVLVAIGIPISTSQLEKSREAVDLSDVRSAYAEVMMAAITGDTTAYYTKDANQTIYDSQNSVYTITVTPLKQKQSGWQTAEPITIGGVSSKAGEPYWKGQPGPDGYCIVTYHPKDDYVSFYWSGGNDSSNPGVTPIEPNPWDSVLTPTPTPIPGNSGGETNGAIFDPSGLPYKVGENSIVGNIYLRGDEIYIATATNACEEDPNIVWHFAKVERNQVPLTEKNKNDRGVLENVVRGTIYKDGNDYYVCTNLSSHLSTPPESLHNWVKINMNSASNYPG